MYEALIKLWGHRKRYLALITAGVAGSLTNTLLVMNFIYLFFGGRYAEASGKAFKGLYMVILGVICMNGIPEAILAGILTLALASALFKVKQ